MTAPTPTALLQLHCKLCRYWYGADTDARAFGTGRFAASRVLSAPYLAVRRSTRKGVP